MFERLGQFLVGAADLPSEVEPEARLDPRTLDQKSFDQREVSPADLPSLIYIETTMACNFRCKFCPVPTPRESMGGRKPVIMSREVFDRVLAAISDRPRTVSLTLMGEPLLHRDIGYFVKSLKTHGHYVVMTSNGALLSAQKSRELLSAGLDQMIISFDGADQNTYEMLRVRGDFERVVKNVRAFARLREELGLRCRLHLDCIVSDATITQQGDFKILWGDTADQIGFLPLDDWGGRVELPKEMGISTSIPIERDSKARHPCHLLWTTATISAEGQIIYCCHDFKLASKLPNVLKKDLREIWRDDLAAERRRHTAGDYKGSPCEHCRAWASMPEYYDRGDSYKKWLLLKEEKA
jgi:radical SAM protein with 4Fe4S-binding SPASM domain